MTKTPEEIKELGKIAVDYERQETMFGKNAADNVLNFWILGYHASQDSQFTQPISEELQQEGWRETEDDPPPANTPVLVEVKDAISQDGRFTVNSWMSYTDKDLEWFKKKFIRWKSIPI